MKKLSTCFIVTESPWPFCASTAGLATTSSLVVLINYNIWTPLFLSLTATILCAFCWWKDILQESTIEGRYTQSIFILQIGGILLFIISELFLFGTFCITINYILDTFPLVSGGLYFREHITIFNPWRIPFLNTLILLSSGVSLTWAHECSIKNLFRETTKSLAVTVILGFWFVSLQGCEYWKASFGIWDGAFPGAFFLITGFHGIHVIVGALFLTVNLYQITNFKICYGVSASFEASIWYWHFVDGIWFIVYWFCYICSYYLIY